MSTTELRLAALSDLPPVLELMRGYYRDDKLPFEAECARTAMSRLLSEPQWGRVYLIEAEQAVVGYIAICIGFSLELGGNDAFIDELYVLPTHRGQGHAWRALEFVTQSAASWGITALHLEVDRENTAAQRLYARLGYKSRDRYFFMTKTVSN